jgi:hypothetical protein
MNEQNNRLPHDIKALRYMDALNANDLEAIEGLWMEAGADPRLERALTEIDAALFFEEAEAGRQANRPRVFTSRRRVTIGVGLVGIVGVVATCILIFVAWRNRHEKQMAPLPSMDDVVKQVVRDRQSEFDGSAQWRQGGHVLDEEAIPTFSWPLAESPPFMASSPITPDLLN